jgi:hypothetical protein
VTEAHRLKVLFGQEALCASMKAKRKASAPSSILPFFHPSSL